MEMFEVGGCVRDEILGARSKDIDFSFVFDDGDVEPDQDPYTLMVEWLENLNVKIIRDNDGIPVGAQHLTARGIAPKDFPRYPSRALDFVLARKESEYSDGRRPDSVEMGTLQDDLARRDFTMNAIAKAADGSLIDPFNGRGDIAAKVIKAVGDPVERLEEDALRAVRALRFAVTKGFSIDPALDDALESVQVCDAIRENISDERIQVELSKMFRYDTVAGIELLSQYRYLTRAMFSGSVSLDATLKTKGRGK